MHDLFNNPTFWTSLAAVVLSIATAAWSWRVARATERTRGDTATLGGLLGEFKDERKVLAARIVVLESENRTLTSRVSELERALATAGIALPHQRR